MARLNSGGFAALSALTARVTDLETASGDVAFGNDVIGVTLQTLTSNTKMVGKLTATAAGQVPYIEVWLDGNGGSSGSQAVKGVLFADDGTGNNPGALLSVSAQTTLTAGTTGAWVRFYLLTPPNVTNTQVLWGGWHAGTTGAVGRYAIGASGALRYNSDTLSDGTTNPFGSPTSTGQLLSVRAIVQDNTASQITALETDITDLQTADADIDERLAAVEAGGAGITVRNIVNFPIPANAVIESTPGTSGLTSISAVGDQTIASASVRDTVDGTTFRTRASDASGSTTYRNAQSITSRLTQVQVVNGGSAQGDFSADMTIA